MSRQEDSGFKCNRFPRNSVTSCIFVPQTTLSWLNCFLLCFTRRKKYESLETCAWCELWTFLPSPQYHPIAFYLAIFHRHPFLCQTWVIKKGRIITKTARSFRQKLKVRFQFQSRHSFWKKWKRCFFFLFCLVLEDIHVEMCKILLQDDSTEVYLQRFSRHCCAEWAIRTSEE
jgi:hypothetical protein